MHQWSVSLSLIVSASILAGCATPYLQGRTALQQGRYDEAATYFERVLAGEPGGLMPSPGSALPGTSWGPSTRRWTPSIAS